MLARHKLWWVCCWTVIILILSWARNCLLWKSSACHLIPRCEDLHSATRRLFEVLTIPWHSRRYLSLILKQLQRYVCKLRRKYSNRKHSEQPYNLNFVYSINNTIWPWCFRTTKHIISLGTCQLTDGCMSWMAFAKVQLITAPLLLNKIGWMSSAQLLWRGLMCMFILFY